MNFLKLSWSNKLTKKKKLSRSNHIYILQVLLFCWSTSKTLIKIAWSNKAYKIANCHNILVLAMIFYFSTTSLSEFEITNLKYKHAYIALQLMTTWTWWQLYKRGLINKSKMEQPVMDILWHGKIFYGQINIGFYYLELEKGNILFFLKHKRFLPISCT